MAPSILLASEVPRVGVAVFILHPFPLSPPSTTTHAVPPYFTHFTQSKSRKHPSPKSCKFLLGKRLGSHGAGSYALPGGHLEFGETFEECARREVKEETDLDIDIVDVRFLTATNDFMPDEGGARGEEWAKGKHYVTIFMTATVKDLGQGERTGGGMPEVKTMEPEKCAGWEWVSWQDLVRWAQPQMTALGHGDGNGEEGVKSRDERTLFSPMIALLVQRPDATLRLR
jgi:8-oxo-dGTP diphosphatase